MRGAAIAIALALLACGPPREPLRMSSAGDVTEGGSGGAGEESAASGPPPAWLWEISREGTPPSYALGTMHLGVLFDHAVPPPLDEHLYQARAVVMEIDPREVQRMMASAPASRRHVPRREQLDRALPPATWMLLVDELGGMVPPEILRLLPPGLVALHLQQVRMAEVEATLDGRTPVRGAASTARLDMSIFEWAVSSGRPVVALETPEQAFAALAAIQQGSAIDALRGLVERADEARAEAGRLRRAYLTLDDAGIGAVIAEMGPEATEALLTVRNHAWMERLVPELEQGNAFVAVGLAHLVGPDSVFGMLSERGFTIRRIGAIGPIAPAEE